MKEVIQMPKVSAFSQGWRMAQSYYESPYSNKKRQKEIFKLAEKGTYFPKTPTGRISKLNINFVKGWNKYTERRK